jgi:cell division protein FtsB
MAYFKRTNIFKSIVFSRGMALLVLFVIVFVGYGLVSVVQKSIEASNARKIAESQATELKAKQADLSNKIRDLNTPEGQEKALRQQFPVVKEGEHVVVITDNAQEAVASAIPVSAQTSGGGFWSFLRSLFK